jgi:hypothetical protein
MSPPAVRADSNRKMSWEHTFDATITRGGFSLTSQGSPYSIFKRALRSGDLARVRAAATELPRVPLDDAFAICLLILEQQPDHYERAAVRWRRTYISLLLAAGCDPAYVQQQVGHTDPTLTLRIYQQLLKRKRREEYRARVNELLGTSPAALSRLPEPAHRAAVGPKSGPNSLLEAA